MLSGDCLCELLHASKCFDAMAGIMSHFFCDIFVTEHPPRPLLEKLARELRHRLVLL